VGTSSRTTTGEHHAVDRDARHRQQQQDAIGGLATWSRTLCPAIVISPPIGTRRR